jgi:hypothetical protein
MAYGRQSQRISNNDLDNFISCPLLKITTATTRDTLNQVPNQTNIQCQNTRNNTRFDTPIMIQDKCDKFHLPVVRFLLGRYTEPFESLSQAFSTSPTVIAMWCQAQRCHSCSLASWEQTRFVLMGGFQHRCVGVKCGGSG